MLDHYSDIGKLIQATKTTHQINEDVRKLTSQEKYGYLTNHFKPSSSPDYIYPTTYIGGCNRSFRSHYTNIYPWLVYSPSLDGAFCKNCTLFASETHRDRLGVLVNKPFTQWNKLNERFKSHSKSDYHHQSTERAEAFIQTIIAPEKTVPTLLDNEKQANIHRNRRLVKTIAETVLLCGRQCIPLRGDHEKADTEGNPGNFLALLKFVSGYNISLKDHLSSPQYRNATYVSPQTQNELINIIGKQIIQRKIIEEVREAQYFSILADEVTSHNQEQLALCVRFVDAQGQIREEFIEFLKLKNITGLNIAATIKQELSDLCLPIQNIVGQGYDGASNMSSAKVGVQKSIRDEAPLAAYVHCGGHCLNLVIAHSCHLTEIRNALDKIKACFLFFKFSPKRNGVLTDAISKSEENQRRKKPLLELCKTRWAERHDAYTRFKQSYPYIVKALENIGYGLHKDELENQHVIWDSKSKQDAVAILSSLTSFDFLVNFLTVYQLLSHLGGITVKLQNSALDILAAYNMVSTVSHLRYCHSKCTTTLI